MMPIVFENVSKTFQDTVALRNISITLPAQTTTAVIGPSGSGKSTLIQIINGLVRPDAGRVRVFGQDIDYDHPTHLRKQIGYAVQGTGLFPHLTVAKNIGLLAILDKKPAMEIRARVAELMEVVDLPREYVDKYPHQLSGGEQQRVGLCRAMMLRPPLFLLDEAFGALDPITRNELHAEFLKLQHLEPRTIVMVTHDMREAVRLAQFIVILNRGEVEQMAATEQILHEPKSSFVKDFVHAQLSDILIHSST